MLTTKLRDRASAWRVLIVDDKSLRVVSSACKMSDLAEACVSGTRRRGDERDRREGEPNANAREVRDARVTDRWTMRRRRRSQ